MSTPSPAISAASISDRGLSEKRPLNEDSYLADPQRGIFVVADGVGGGDAGEVASQTAVDVLDEAFRHKTTDGDDIEDLMELAIQRANSSIHQMASEHPRFSMMATTVVALHLNGNRATIGHVGDSRLYRVMPDGTLLRETEDHSIVEEEVRAGRMTPEQAANHPSKNVISRALGAEESVEVDMKTIEVADGSAFLLCTDGITRHISDGEIRDLLISGKSLDDVCFQMKEVCYQRGAEDNLTAVVVNIGTPRFHELLDDERTVSSEKFGAPALAETTGSGTVESGLTAPSRIAFPGQPAPQQATAMITPAPQKRSGLGRALLRFFLFLLFLGVAAGGFYGGMRFQQERSAPIPTATPTPLPASDNLQQKKSALDRDPPKWLADNLKDGGKPADSKDPEFLYLYGRALMLTGKHKDAMQAFELALTNLRNENQASLPFGAEVRLAEAAAALKLNQPGANRSQQTIMAEQKAAQTLDEILGIKNGGPQK